MPISRLLTATILSTAIFLGGSAVAHAVELKPSAFDPRIAVEDISQDKVDLIAPYGFHEDYGYEPIFDLADWACGLYERHAVGLSVRPSDDACDQMGAAAAKREWSCFHVFIFARAISTSFTAQLDD